MRNVTFILALALSACGGSAKDQASNVQIGPADLAKAELVAGAEVVIIGTKDGKKVYASHVPVQHGRATIVLLHQAGSSAYEFADIAPRLNDAGYSTLAVDLRSGGSLYGNNRTVAHAGRSADTYEAALPDIEAALNWARLQGQPVILLGSSYSAGLIFQTAADKPDLVAALIAYSPGEYFTDKHLVRKAATKLRMPVFISQAKEPGEIAQSKTIYDALQSQKKTLFEGRAGGIHGASTLRADRNASGSEENWRALMAFLESMNLLAK